MNDFHFVIFSRLQSFGGGRETWLNQFLPELLNQDPAASISVYYIVDRNTDHSMLLPIVTDARLAMVPINLPVGSNLLISFFRILKFVLVASFKLHRKSDKNSKVFAIGSFYEAAVIFLLHLVTLKKYQPMLAIWLRGIWRKEMLARHDGLIRSAAMFVENMYLKSANLVIANGWDTAKAYKENNAVDAVVIPNSIILERYINIPKLSFGSRPIKVSFIGRLSKEKGVLDFLDSIERFNSAQEGNSKRILFEVVGDGPLRSRVEEYVSKLPNLTFIGPLSQTEIPEYLQSVDVGVGLMYSTGEMGGAGVTHGMLEIIASGRLLICWDGITFTQVVDNHSALIVPEGDVSSLVNAYEAVLQDLEQMSQIARNGQEISKVYSLQSHVSRFISAVV